MNGGGGRFGEMVVEGGKNQPFQGPIGGGVFCTGEQNMPRPKNERRCKRCRGQKDNIIFRKFGIPCFRIGRGKFLNLVPTQKGLGTWD